MDKEQTKAAIAVMQAYVDGNQIEVKGRGVGWCPCATDPTWDWTVCEYRVKPEPKLRPWTPVEAAAYLGLGVIHKESAVQMTIVSVEVEGVDLRAPNGTSRFVNYRDLLESYAGFQGIPCGVLETPQ